MEALISNVTVGVITGIISSIIVTLFFREQDLKRVFNNETYRHYQDVMYLVTLLDDFKKFKDTQKIYDYFANEPIPLFVRLEGIKLQESVRKAIIQTNVAIESVRKAFFVEQIELSPYEIAKLRSELINAAMNLRGVHEKSKVNRETAE
jgi:predicted small secreted protein